MAIGPFFRYTPPSADPLPVYIRTFGHVVEKWEPWNITPKIFRANYVEINGELVLINLDDLSFSRCTKCDYIVIKILNFDGVFSWGFYPVSVKLSCDEAMVQKILSE